MYFNKKRLKCMNQQEEDGNILNACLEVAPLDWEDDENSPDLCNNDAHASQSKQRRTDQPSRNVNTIQPILPPTNSTILNHKRNLFDDDDSCSSTTVECEDVFSHLVDEILLHIFSYLTHSSLTKCVQVSKRWKQLGYDETLWKEVNLDSKHITCSGVLGSILHRGVKVLRLSKAEVLAPICTNDSIPSHFNRCSNFSLVQLDATMTKFEVDNLACLLFRCTSLKFLSLEGCKMDLREITAVSFNSNLEVLNLSLTMGLTSAAIDVVTRKCLQLRSLNLSWTNQTRDCIRYISRCKQLEELNLSGLRGGINRKIMEKLVMSCLKFIELDLSDVTLQIGVMKLIADNSKFLQKLSISRCSDVKAEQLQDLTKLESLSHLNLFGFINSDALERFSNVRPDIYINKGTFSPIARPIATTTYEGRLWEQYSGFII